MIYLGCSLGVADVSHLWLSGNLENVIDLGRDVKLAVFKEAVVKELAAVSLGIELGVLASVPISAVIAHPDVVALVREHDAR